MECVKIVLVRIGVFCMGFFLIKGVWDVKSVDFNLLVLGFVWICYVVFWEKFYIFCGDCFVF